ncbi:NIPSNAP family protein [Litoreibacter roseus]|uniref:NIPSNAP family containing protein n=1 Tax=Litoreibacter roseus TaxID=2601869 RepID=A0A6N6JFS7_9RHOB|nr:NIPSNAP family protein [Litoreibacter roseus]GFE65211.1 NIPSNAP family containing protein [Litoreibacter roseus]
MITCTIRYEVDPTKLDAFEIYARAWIYLVNKLGGTHHGYWLPHEGANDIAWAMFSFPSLAAYEDYRVRMAADDECNQAYAHAANTRCIRRYDRSFTRPILDGASPDELGLA